MTLDDEECDCVWEPGTTLRVLSLLLGFILITGSVAGAIFLDIHNRLNFGWIIVLAGPAIFGGLMCITAMESQKNMVSLIRR